MMATVRKRNNSYQIRVSVGYDSSGKQIVRTLTWKPDTNLTLKQQEKELKKQIFEFEKKVLDGYAINQKMTFEKYSAYVLELKERTGVKRRTIDRYHELLGRINPLIGFMKIDEIRPAHLNKLYADLSAEGLNKVTGGKLSNKTVLEHHRLISTIMTQAEKEMMIMYNPANKATPPKQIKKEVNYFQVDEVVAIREALVNEPIKWKVITYLLMVTGCRRGEILGLKWSKIDFTNNSIHIDNNLLYSKRYGIYEDTPKTPSSLRSIKIPISVMELLNHYKMWQNDQLMILGDSWVHTDFVFTNETGGPMHPDSITGWLRKFATRHNLPNINPHAFRHTMASVLFFNGADSVSISKRLGHAKVSTTTDVYSHIIKEADEKAADCIGDILLGIK